MSSRRRMLEFLSLSRLPTEYQEVEYISTTGVQYVDSGFTPNQDSRMIIDYQKTLFEANRIIGCRLTTIYQGFAFGGTSSTTPISNMVSYGNQSATNLGNLDLQRHKLDLNKNNVYFDGTLVYSFNYETFNSYGNIYIGTINTTSIVSGHVGKIYSCKIYDNETLIRDFVPCYRKSDNVIGLYDLVNDVFYTNAGTGTFTKGADI